jgi:hypothetical protein
MYGNSEIAGSPQGSPPAKLGIRSDEALNASSLQFFAIVKRFITSLL